jgi:hypothetical protein
MHLAVDQPASTAGGKEFDSIAVWIRKNQVGDDGLPLIAKHLDRTGVHENMQPDVALGVWFQRISVPTGESWMKGNVLRLCAVDEERSCLRVVTDDGLSMAWRTSEKGDSSNSLLQA